MAPSSSSSSSSTASRRRPRKRLTSIALSATAALCALTSISPVHAASGGGVRGAAAHSRHRAQHEPHEYDATPHTHLLAGDHSNESYRRYLFADEENLVGPSSFTQTLDVDVDVDDSVDNAHDGDDGQRKLGSRNKHGDDDDDGIVTISPFTTTLLSVNFPYSLKCNTNQRCSSITTTYLASYLNGAMGGKVDMLGLNCTKSTQKSAGGEDRHVLSCEGQVTFTTSPDSEPPKRTAVNSAVRNAFLGEAKHKFLQQMYAKYEMLREKSLFESARTSRAGGSVTRGIQPRTAAGGRKVGRKKRNKKVGKKKKNGGGGAAIQGKMLSFVGGGGGGGGGSSSNKKKKNVKLSGGTKSKPGNKKNVHNIDGSGKNAFGYQSGKANTGPKNSDTDKKGNIIVKVGGGR